LAIPPAWTSVWICPSRSGHLQATGRDARGRKQYRYHSRWREVRDSSKYDRLIAFAEALPQVRQCTARDLALPGLPRQKVLATVVQLLEKTLIRIGNDEYARANHSYGLTTLRDGHVDVSGSRLRFEFRGKSGIRHSVDISDRRLARIVKSCQDLPGHELFQYMDADGTRQTVDSADVNAYVREIAGHDFTAKDFRTWAGTVLAACALKELASFTSSTQAKRNIVQAIESVAKRLGNTKAVCRKCYVHPAVIEWYEEGTVIRLSARRNGKTAKVVTALSPEEAAVLALLQQRVKRAETRKIA
jgi:DNA topoisomerase-1